MRSTWKFAFAVLFGTILQKCDCSCCGGKSLAICEPDGTLETLHTTLCSDCHRGTPYCGNLACNIFGCNCEGGCVEDRGCKGKGCRRREKRSIREPGDENRDEVESVMVVLDRIDQNKDGKLDLDELNWWRDEHKGRYVPVDANMTSELFKLDANNDRFLTADEID